MSADDAPEVLAEAERLGVIVPIGEHLYEVPSPSLLAVAEEVVARGVSLQSALAVLDEIERHLDSVSRSFVDVFLGEVWKPFQQADMPPERWPELEQAVQRLRPIAGEALITIFQQRLSTQIESAFGEITRRLSGERTHGSQGRGIRRGPAGRRRYRLTLSASVGGRSGRRLGQARRPHPRGTGMPVSAWDDRRTCRSSPGCACSSSRPDPATPASWPRS